MPPKVTFFAGVSVDGERLVAEFEQRSMELWQLQQPDSSL
jgi:hypothetical protein